MADLTPWNKGRNVGQKRALRPQDVWMIRGRLRAEGRKRDLALLNLAIDSKLFACDLVALQVKDVCHHRVHRSFANSEGASQRSGESARRAGAQPGQGGFTANSQQADLGHRLSTPGSVSFDSEPIGLF
jgi:hypothetical protein